MQWHNQVFGFAQTGRDPDGAGEIDEDELTSRLSDNLLDQLEEMDYEERQIFLDELASNPELWDEDGEVMVA